MLLATSSDACWTPLWSAFLASYDVASSVNLALNTCQATLCS